MINNYVDFCYNLIPKINEDKCSVVSFGYYNNHNAKFFIDDKEIKKKNELEYLGFMLRYNLDDNLSFNNKFHSVRSSFYALSSYGLNPYGINPFLQSFIYKTFCISKCLYGIELMSLNKSTINKINVNQNILIKSMLGKSKYCHTSDLLKVLRVFDINNLIIFMKLSFIKNLNYNKLSYKISFSIISQY